MRQLVVSFIILGACVTGCADPQAGSTTDQQTLKSKGFRDDIFKVVSVFPQNMWQSYDAAGTADPEGFKFIVYLLSVGTKRGALADGFLHVQMYYMEPLPNGSKLRRLVRKWSYHTSEIPKRAYSKMTGYSYQPSLRWDEQGPGEFYGEEVEIVVQFESAKGNVIQGQTKLLRVPSRRR